MCVRFSNIENCLLTTSFFYIRPYFSFHIVTVSENEFLSVSELIRGRAKLVEVNQVCFSREVL